MSQLAELNRRFAIPGMLEFKALPNGYIAASIANKHAGACIALQGAHILSFQPRGQEPVIWLSPLAKFEAGKSVRGGVPVCWPWFGPHASNPAFPGHGFARTVPWRVASSEMLEDGATRIAFEIEQNDATRAQWPHASSARLTATVGKTLHIELTTRNNSYDAFTIGEALHTYFHISDIGKVEVTGLNGCDYLDKVGAGGRKTQQGALTFSGETDRIYLNTPGNCAIVDSGLKRRIRIASENSRSTVVWTPWTEKADKMGDFGPDGWGGMVCVETANAADNVVRVGPQSEHCMSVTYSVEKM
ncbi:MAG: D-hexose-6-phosphate mutarotase [Pseudomonadota bacterium]